jgi:ribosomal protein L37AE/L43A
MKRRRPKPVHQMTIAQFEAIFTDEEACRVYLIARRWPSGVACPRCGNPEVYALASGFHWQCTQCAPGGSTGYRFSHIAGTIFENTNKPLRVWFRVVHTMLTSKKRRFGSANSADHGLRLLRDRAFHVPQNPGGAD